MSRETISDLLVFLAVAREQSFTKAAIRLGLSQSAISHTIRSLEERLGLRLLTRTTRSVSPTQAGERLLRNIGPKFEEISAELAELRELQEKPAGTIRITTAENAAQTILWPKLAEFLPNYPDIRVEVTVDYGLRDIVADRYDAGIRIGEQVAKDMIAVRIGPDMCMAVIASPDYIARRGTPTIPQDLLAHSCINLRLPTYDSFLAWDFEKEEKVLSVHVNGQVAFNSCTQIYEACLQGFGFAFLPESVVATDLTAGRLIRVLADWCQPFPGYHLYYPGNRQSSAAFTLLVNALRYRPSAG